MQLEDETKRRPPIQTSTSCAYPKQTWGGPGRAERLEHRLLMDIKVQHPQDHLAQTWRMLVPMREES